MKRIYRIFVIKLFQSQSAHITSTFICDTGVCIETIIRVWWQTLIFTSRWSWCGTCHHDCCYFWNGWINVTSRTNCSIYWDTTTFYIAGNRIHETRILRKAIIWEICWAREFTLCIVSTKRIIINMHIGHWTISPEKSIVRTIARKRGKIWCIWLCDLELGTVVSIKCEKNWSISIFDIDCMGSNIDTVYVIGENNAFCFTDIPNNFIWIENFIFCFCTLIQYKCGQLCSISVTSESRCTRSSNGIKRDSSCIFDSHQKTPHTITDFLSITWVTLTLI